MDRLNFGRRSVQDQLDSEEQVDQIIATGKEFDQLEPAGKLDRDLKIQMVSYILDSFDQLESDGFVPGMDTMIHQVTEVLGDFAQYLAALDK